MIDLNTLPSLPLTNRKQLPAISAVYFCLDSNGQLLYVGKTVNLQQRWQQHHRYAQLELIEGVQLAWMSCEVELLEDTEEDLISLLSPLYNRAPVARPRIRQTSDVPNFSITAYLFSRLRVLMAEQTPPLSQAKLAEDTKLAVQTINQLYHSKMKRVDVKTVETLCNYFGCDLSDLFVFKGQDND